jgi:hypothetical protein
MRPTILLFFLIQIQASLINVFAQQSAKNKGLPNVFENHTEDRLFTQMRALAIEKAKGLRLPDDMEKWNLHKEKLKENIIKQTGAILKQQLPLDMKETKVIKKKGFTVKNIYFQTQPNIYATANLYIPDGEGPFPAVIVMSGHSKTGKTYKNYNEVGQTLALNGYVSLNIDPWGAGERATQHGEFEYHGSKLGVSLVDVGVSLMGMQITDNIRGVDLLSSLPYVDAKNIGATGASGGGNQTMWLAALDKRVKAAVPVVSVGSFESYVMRHNCVCEVLHNGLTFTEEDAILALVAPRAIKMCNANFDSNPTFYPSEMLKTFHRAQPIFNKLGVGNNISYQNFDLRHGYFPEVRETMLGWFNLHLKNKGTGEPVKGVSLEFIDEKELMVFPTAQRDPKVLSTVDYCRIKSQEFKSKLFATEINVAQKRNELHELLKRNNREILKEVHQYGAENGWDKIGLETTEGKIIPVLHKKPAVGHSNYTIVCNPKGKSAVSYDFIKDLNKNGTGIVLIDLWGTGENSSVTADKFDSNLVPFHTLSRTSLWLGKTVMGEWLNELEILTGYLKKEKSAKKIAVNSFAEAGVAALLLSSLSKEISALTLYDAPLSYQLADKENINFYSMAVHIPGVLVWGDVSLMAALTEADIKFINPLTISGSKIDKENLDVYRKEFHQLKQNTGRRGLISFID